METVFNYANTNRRAAEFTLTSSDTNSIYYGTPGTAKKRDIWPPLSSDLGLNDTLFYKGEIAKGHEPGPTSSEIHHRAIYSEPPRTLIFPNPERLYEPLHEGSDIRLIGLEPGVKNDPLRLHFYYANLDAIDLRYEALSYVWGEVVPPYLKGKWHPPRDIAFLNGHELYIPKNLNAALRSLRLSTKLRIIWADSICINQNDVAERGHQVSLMSSIYSSASQVVVWLGEHDSDVNSGILAYGAVCQLVNHWLGEQEGIRKASFDTVAESGEQRTLEDSEITKIQNEWLGSPDLTSVTNSPYDLATSPQFWEAISRLFAQTWFWRLWVFQEVVLAPFASVRMGSAEIDWRWIGIAAAILRTNHSAECDKMRLGGIYNAYLMFRLSRRSDLPSIRLDFLRLLRLTRQFEVSDPLDRIYGLLGIKTKDNDPETGNLLIVPDYTITIRELCHRIAIQLLTKDKNLSMLSCVQYSSHKLESETGYCLGDSWNKRSEETLLPSWVPQWDRVFRATLSPWDKDEEFSTSKGLPRTCVEPLSPTRLFLQGAKIGLIGYCSLLMWHDADFTLLQSKHLGKFFASPLGLRLLARTLTAGRNTYGSIKQETPSLVADMAAFILSYNDKTHNFHRIQSSFEKLEFLPALNKMFLEKFGGSNSAGEYKEAITKMQDLAARGHAEQFAHVASTFCERRRLFFTLNGFLGLGPDTVREGDVLCVFNGVDMPYLLRPCTGKELKARSRNVGGLSSISLSGSGDHYLLVGECYVEGIMNGEVAKHLRSSEPFVGPVPTEPLLDSVLEKAKRPHARTMHNYDDELPKPEELRKLAEESLDEMKASSVEVLQRSWFSIL